MYVHRVHQEVKDNVVQCLGSIGYMMGQEAKRFVLALHHCTPLLVLLVERQKRQKRNGRSWVIRLK